MAAAISSRENPSAMSRFSSISIKTPQVASMIGTRSARRAYSWSVEVTSSPIRSAMFSMVCPEPA